MSYPLTIVPWISLLPNFFFPNSHPAINSECEVSETAKRPRIVLWAGEHVGEWPGPVVSQKQISGIWHPLLAGVLPNGDTVNEGSGRRERLNVSKGSEKNLIGLPTISAVLVICLDAERRPALVVTFKNLFVCLNSRPYAC
jgi:hypothetical protein